MYFEQLEYVHSDIPKTSDSWVQDVMGKQLWDEFYAFDMNTRDLRDKIWPGCDRAYLCYGDLPKAEAMKWVDQGKKRETDIKDGIDFMTDSIMGGVLPRDDSAFTLLSPDPDDQAELNGARDLIASLCRKADMRANIKVGLKQAFIRGTTAWRVGWQAEYRMRRFGRIETILKLKQMGRDMGFKNVGALDKIRFPELITNAPIIVPIDMYHMFLDPFADIEEKRGIAYVYRMFKTVEDLEAAVDEDGNHLYDQEALKEIAPWTIEEIYQLEPKRRELIETLGVSPIPAGSSDARYIPVLLFHKPVRTFKDDQGNKETFVDTYFYLALSRVNNGYKVIRIQENPSDFGHKCIYAQTLSDWVSGTAYGKGIVEDALSAWNQKNVLSALTLNAQVASVFPTYNIIGDVLFQEREFKVGNGGVNIIKWKPSIGLNFMAPIPAPAQGAQMGMQDQQWAGQKILGALGAYGAVAQDPTKSIKTAKTATQINTESTSGSVSRDDLIERIAVHTVEPIIQNIYDQARQQLTDQMISFEVVDGANAQAGQISRSALDKDRRVVITGYHGLLNKQQEIEQMKEILGVLTTGNAAEVLANYPLLLQEVLYRLLGRLGVKNLERFKKDPMELLLENPMVRQQIMQMGQIAYQQGVQDAHRPPQIQVSQPAGNFTNGQPGQSIPIIDTRQPAPAA